jgi:hypothetical protein
MNQVIRVLRTNIVLEKREKDSEVGRAGTEREVGTSRHKKHKRQKAHKRLPSLRFLPFVFFAPLLARI